MRRAVVASALLVATVCLTGAQAPASGVYDPNPGHLWNRLHDALFLRHDAAGREYGRDRIEPLLWRTSKHLLHGDSHDRLLAALKEFIGGGKEQQITDPLKRAMLQRDLWLVFSWLEHGREEVHAFPGGRAAKIAAGERLREPLARAIGRVALTAGEIARLPDTYAAAVASGEFAARPELASEERSYLPPDLFAGNGPWVSLGRDDGPIAPTHLLADNPFTNSAFLVFIKLPGGRPATLAYVDRLRAFRGPMFVATPSTPKPEFPNFSPDIPQFPPGTEVALVRRALLVTSARDIVVTPIAEAVEVRVYREVPAVATSQLQSAMLVDGRVRSRQAAFEFVLSRRRLFDGRSGGLHTAVDGHMLTGFSTHGFDPFDEGFVPRMTDAEARRHRSDLCIMCHTLPGVYSFNTFAHGPSIRQRDSLRAMSAQNVLAQAVRWKTSLPEWSELRRLMAEPTVNGLWK
jgi:hypothetical protein